jgi:hypothetical protein
MLHIFEEIIPKYNPYFENSFDEMHISIVKYIKGKTSDHIFQISL